MSNPLLALVIGLAAGVCGALVPGMLRGGSAPAGEAGGGSVDLAPVLERLDRIEAQLAASRPLLRGSGGGEADAPPVPLPRLAEEDEAVLDALLERYEARLREIVGETLDEKLTPILKVSDISEVEPVLEKKQVTLAELAQELELSTYQEDELRRIHEESMEKALALLATEEDGGVETVRRDFEEAGRDPTKATAVIGKYMGRLIPNLGGFIMLEQEHKKRIQDLLGEEKAQRLENEYDVTDVDPYDLEAVFSMGFGE